MASVNLSPAYSACCLCSAKGGFWPKFLLIVRSGCAVQNNLCLKACIESPAWLCVCARVRVCMPACVHVLVCVCACVLKKSLWV